MKDSKINMNRPPLSNNEIESSKDFNGLMNQYQNDNGDPENPQKSPSKKWWKIGIAGIAAGIAGFFAIDFSDEEKKTTSDEISNNSPIEISYALNTPPIPGKDIAFIEYELSSKKGDTITTSTGTKIIIPEGAFLDKNGNPISGPVNLRFREFHDVPSIFEAGINMEYDSAGQTYHFESAGMFEIEASQNDQELSTNPKQPIMVQLASNQPGDYFNIYYQDPEKGWQFIEKDTAKLLSNNKLNVPSKKDVEKALKKYKKALKKENIVLPQLANNDYYAMQLNFKQSEFPELAPYSNILFEIGSENKNFTSELAKKQWEDIELSKNIAGNYVMTLYGEQKVKLFVSPVFSAEELASANQTFDQLFEEYTATNGDKLQKEREEYQTIYAAYKQEQDEVITFTQNNLNANAIGGLVNAKLNKVVRVFQVAEFGMWNSDCPQNLPKGQSVLPVFVNAKNINDTLKFSTLCIAEYNKNALYRLWGDWGNKKYVDDKGKERSLFENPEFTFNPENETVIWCITDKGQMAVIKPDSLKKITFNEGQNTTIKMSLHVSVGDDDHIKNLLEWK